MTTTTATRRLTEGSGFVGGSAGTTLVCIEYFIWLHLQQICSKISPEGCSHETRVLDRHGEAKIQNVVQLVLDHRHR